MKCNKCYWYKKCQSKKRLCAYYESIRHDPRIKEYKKDLKMRYETYIKVVKDYI